MGAVHHWGRFHTRLALPPQRACPACCVCTRPQGPFQSALHTVWPRHPPWPLGSPLLLRVRPEAPPRALARFSVALQLLVLGLWQPEGGLSGPASQKAESCRLPLLLPQAQPFSSADTSDAGLRRCTISRVEVVALVSLVQHCDSLLGEACQPLTGP